MWRLYPRCCIQGVGGCLGGPYPLSVPRPLFPRLEWWCGVVCSEAWVPYKANDMQLEFVMLDPYVRKGMTHDNKGTFTGQFKVCVVCSVCA
jgi:hypothetical protein